MGTFLQIKLSFDKSLKLKKFKEAWSFASALDSEDCWSELRSAALYHFDIETGKTDTLKYTCTCPMPSDV